MVGAGLSAADSGDDELTLGSWSESGGCTKYKNKQSVKASLQNVHRKDLSF